MRLGVAAIARPTFDVEFAAETAARAFAVIDSLGDISTVGPRRLVLAHEDLVEAQADLVAGDLDGLVVLQASFADSTLVTALAELTDGPIILWAFPEPRTGGRLRLNSLCGINLAAYVLRTAGREVRYLYLDPWTPDAAETLRGVLGAAPHVPAASTGQAATGYPASPAAAEAATVVAERLATARIGIVGDHPTGFDPCAYDPGALFAATGARAETVPLKRMFDRGAEASTDRVASVRAAFAAELADLDNMDADALDKSIRIHLGLQGTAGDLGWDALATRCWPECFTEFGGAACGPQSLLNERHGIPALCEADAYGAVTSLILQWLTGGKAFVADLVHLDPSDDTAVFWHCGLAPVSMADDEATPTATVHSNRELPLLYEFPLRPGRITIARLSQSRHRHRLVVGGAEMVRAPLAFSGTAGVAKLDNPAADMLDTVMTEGLEHHYGIVYGDVREELRALAGRLDLPLVEL